MQRFLRGLADSLCVYGVGLAIAFIHTRSLRSSRMAGFLHQRGGE